MFIFNINKLLYALYFINYFCMIKLNLIVSISLISGGELVSVGGLLLLKILYSSFLLDDISISLVNELEPICSNSLSSDSVPESKIVEISLKFLLNLFVLDLLIV